MRLATWLGLALVPIATAGPSMAQQTSEFVDRTITLIISCSRAGTGTVRILPRASGNIDYYMNGFHTPIVNGSGPNGYSSTINGNILTIHQIVEGLAGVSFTHTITVSANSCSAQHVVQPGQYADSIDPSCRASRCVISPAKRPTTTTPSQATDQRPRNQGPSDKTATPTATKPSQPSFTSPTPPKSGLSSHDAPTVPKPSCGSTITGGNLSPAPRDKCDKAKKWLAEARETRKSWFGTKARAEPFYQEAAKVFREIGDTVRAELAVEESRADDVTVYERAERDADDRPKNLKAAEEAKEIARKIELGAYGSKSCGDLSGAADYYLEAGQLFLKANEFEATNALFLRRDELIAIVDDAEERGVCGGKVTLNWTPPASSQRGTPQGDDRYCKKMAELFERKENRNTEMAAYKIEVAPMCKAFVSITDSDCLRARIHWYEIKHTPEIKHKLEAAGCKAT